MWSRPSVVTFYVDPKSNMAAWPLIVGVILNLFSRMAEGIYSKLATNVPYDILTNC